MRSQLGRKHNLDRMCNRKARSYNVENARWIQKMVKTDFALKNGVDTTSKIQRAFPVEKLRGKNVKLYEVDSLSKNDVETTSK